VPNIAAGRIEAMFEAAGWQTITVKYGRRLRELFDRPGGQELRRRIGEMPNEEYQRLLRSTAGELRERLPGSGRRTRALGGLLAELNDDELLRAIRDLGGHDLGDLLEAFAQRLAREEVRTIAAPAPPADLGRAHAGSPNR
jgi:pyruvate dehydrogenase E1 component